MLHLSVADRAGVLIVFIMMRGWLLIIFTRLAKLDGSELGCWLICLVGTCTAGWLRLIRLLIFITRIGLASFTAVVATKVGSLLLTGIFTFDNRVDLLAGVEFSAASIRRNELVLFKFAPFSSH